MKKKKYIVLITIISLLVLFVPKAHARIIVPALPFDETQTNYVMSYWGSVNKMYLTYCKGSNQRLTIKTSVGENVYSTAIGYCYGPNGEYYGYAYRRGLEATLTKEQINDYEFDLSGDWGEELQSNSYQTPISYIPSEEKLAIYSDYAYEPPNNYDNDAVIITGNTDIYDTDYTTVLLSQEDYNYSEKSEPYCTKEKPLGMFENPKEFSINISGISNALREHVKGIITISYESDSIINSNQWEIIDSVSEFTAGDYTFTCSNENKYCQLAFDYNYEDDIDEEIEINYNIKTINGVSMPTFIRLYSCLQNYNDINITYNSIKNDNNNQTPTENKLDNVIGGIGNILNFLNPANLIYIIVPTEQQMQSLLNEMQEKINSKLGIVGLPLTIYTRFMNLANTSTQDNWCLTWEGVKVPNFEEFEIIGAGSWCFNTILQNQTINTFRNTCIKIIGGLILLSFIQYLNNAYHKIVDSPDRDEYEYITTEDVYNVDNATGELTNHVWKKRRTVREKVNK